MRLPRQCGIQRLEKPGRTEQQPDGVVATALVIGNLPAQVIQQCGLAHARLAVYDQGPALTVPYPVDEPVEHVAFAVPVYEL